MSVLANLFRQARATPNLLTLLRLFTIPFMVISLLDRHNGIALVLFIVSGISDGLDGAIARRFGQSTKLGQYLDPIADKLLLSTLFLTATHIDLVPRYVTILVFARDLGILVIATLLFVTNTLRDFRPSILGKLNTFVQIVTLFLVLIEAVRPSEPWLHLRSGMLVAVAWLAPLSAAQYAWLVTHRLSTEPIQPHSRSGQELSPEVAEKPSSIG